MKHQPRRRLEVRDRDLAREVVRIDPDAEEQGGRKRRPGVDARPDEVIGDERAGRADVVTQVDEVRLDGGPRRVVVDHDVDRGVFGKPVVDPRPGVVDQGDAPVLRDGLGIVERHQLEIQQVHHGAVLLVGDVSEVAGVRRHPGALCHPDEPERARDRVRIRVVVHDDREPALDPSERGVEPVDPRRARVGRELCHPVDEDPIGVDHPIRDRGDAGRHRRVGVGADVHREVRVRVGVAGRDRGRSVGGAVVARDEHEVRAVGVRRGVIGSGTFVGDVGPVGADGGAVRCDDRQPARPLREALDGRARGATTPENHPALHTRLSGRRRKNLPSRGRRRAGMRPAARTPRSQRGTRVRASDAGSGEAPERVLLSVARNEPEPV